MFSAFSVCPEIALFKFRSLPAAHLIFLRNFCLAPSYTYAKLFHSPRGEMVVFSSFAAVFFLQIILNDTVSKQVPETIQNTYTLEKELSLSDNSCKWINFYSTLAAQISCLWALGASTAKFLFPKLFGAMRSKFPQL